MSPWTLTDDLMESCEHQQEYLSAVLMHLHEKYCPHLPVLMHQPIQPDDLQGVKRYLEQHWAVDESKPSDVVLEEIAVDFLRRGLPHEEMASEDWRFIINAWLRDNVEES